jgi:DNA-binding transcriptional ArsR family regulator
MDQYSGGIDTVFLALADPTRRAVVERLGRGPASVTELARPFAMALPSFMKHIRALESSGLVRSHKQGRTRTCTLDRQRLVAIDDWLAGQRSLWEARTDRLERLVTTTEAQEGTYDPDI